MSDILDSKEIARRALFRAEETKARQKGRIRGLIRTATTILCTCVATAALAYIVIPSIQPATLINDEMTPLAAIPANVGGNAPCLLLPGYSKIEIPSGVASVSMILPNPETNLYYLTYEIVLLGTGESLYASDPIPPSAQIEWIEMSRALAEGEYKSGLIIRAYEPHDLTEISCATVTFYIIAVS